MSWQTFDSATIRVSNKEVKDKLLLVRLEALIHSVYGKQKLDENWILFTDNAIDDLLADNSTIIIYSTNSNIKLAKSIIDDLLNKYKLDAHAIIAHDVDSIIDVIEKIYDDKEWNESSLIGTQMGDLNADSDSSNDDYKLAMKIKCQNIFTSATFFTPQVLPEPVYLNTQELILFVGQQGSDKTTFIKQNPLPANYILIETSEANVESRMSKSSYLKKAKDALDNGFSVVVDGTNPSNKSRNEFIDMTINIPVRIFWFSRIGHISDDRISTITLNKYSSEFEIPVNDEERNISVYRIN